MFSCTIVNFQILSGFLDREALFLDSLYQLLPFFDFDRDVAALCAQEIFIFLLFQSFLIGRSGMCGDWVRQDHVIKLRLHEFLSIY
jgi:hypothetical protein